MLSNGGVAYALKLPIERMETKRFFIEFLYNDRSELAEVKPCCQVNNVFYYDISIKNQYQFTVTPTHDDEKGMAWRISFKNSDKQVDPGLIDVIGEEIEKYLL